jgi:hypothetical protein
VRAVRFDPPADNGRIAPAVHVELELAAGVAADDLGLFGGSLSRRDLQLIAAGQASAALLARRVPALVWAGGEPGRARLAPTERLRRAEVYTLALPRAGWSSALRVTDDEATPWLQRVWPLPGDAIGAHTAWCLQRDAGGTVVEHAVDRPLWPGPIAGELGPGALAGLGQDCVHWSARNGPAGGPLAPPAVATLADGRIARIDPVPVGEAGLAADAGPGAQPPGATAATCSPGALMLEHVCVEVADDRALVWPTGGPMLAGIEVAGLARVARLDALRPMLLRPLPSGAAMTGRLVGIGPRGERFESALSWTTAQTGQHPVVNEVMANPVGPEPAQEWVELYNDGVGPVDLGGWILEDNGGKTVLPAFELAPGAFVLVVNEAYRLDSGTDRPPPPGASLLVVPHLGKAGLSNAGEMIRLLSPDGTSTSRVPAIASPAQGASVARVAPDAPDSSPESFVQWPGGGTPGAPNRR